MREKVIDFQEYRNVLDVKISIRLNELEIKIELSLLDFVRQVEFDVFERRLILSLEKLVEYKLDFNFLYLVDDEKGFVRFDKNKYCLIVILLVLL